MRNRGSRQTLLSGLYLLSFRKPSRISLQGQGRERGKGNRIVTRLHSSSALGFRNRAHAFVDISAVTSLHDEPWASAQLSGLLHWDSGTESLEKHSHLSRSLCPFVFFYMFYSLRSPHIPPLCSFSPGV